MSDQQDRPEDELRRLSEAATPGPWATVEDAEYVTVGSTHNDEEVAVVGTPNQYTKADAALIVAAVNHVRSSLSASPLAGPGVDALRRAASRYRAAEWSHRIHADEPVATPEHNARVDEWRAADAVLAALLDESSPYVAPLAGPAIDRERLARAICAGREPVVPTEDMTNDMFVDDECRAEARRVIDRYDRLAARVEHIHPGDFNANCALCLAAPPQPGEPT